MSNIDWSALSFGYIKCNGNIRAQYKDGKWGELTMTDNEYIPLHMSAPSLHYGSEIFEGLKAFTGIDGKIRIFRADENAKRFNSSAERLCMPTVSEEMFIKACVEVVRANKEFVPPYGYGASLYIRPFMIGTEAVLGVKPAHEFLFCVFVSPVGAYYKSGLSPVGCIIDREYDRAAPMGTGNVKCGGNYAASLLAGEKAHEAGYSAVLYLDAKEHKYIEECSAANFFGIKDKKYITPKSNSILPSITNLTLRTIAADLGLEVEQRQVEYDELPTFEECGACGTAAVISPIGNIYDPANDSTINYGESVGEYSHAMYDRLQDIQYGRYEDKYGWTIVVE